MSNLITKEFLNEQLDFWGKLEVTAQKTVQTETAELVNDYNTGVQAALAVGRHLKAVKGALVLEAGREGRWMRYCKNVLPFHYRTAERYIEKFEKIEGQVHERLIEAAIARGIDLVSKDYSEPMKALPMPKDPSAKDAVAWVEKLQNVVENAPRTRHKGRRRVDANEVTISVFRAVSNAYKSIPSKVKHSWAVSFIGKLMQEMGLPAQRLEPEAIPDGYRGQVGRPRTKKAE